MGDDVLGEKKVKGVRNYEPTQREMYLATVWFVIESCLIYSSAAIVQLVTYLLKMNAGVIMKFMKSTECEHFRLLLLFLPYILSSFSR